MIRAVMAIVISLSVIAGASIYKREFQEEQQQAAHSLRKSMVDLQNAQQGYHRVDADRSHPLLAVLGEDMAALQIRLAEALAAVRIDGEPVSVSFEQSVLSTSLDATNLQTRAGEQSHSVAVLRVDLRARLLHTPHLLQFLQTVSRAATGWPSDIRACRIDRMDGQSLNVHCVMDIYHW